MKECSRVMGCGRRRLLRNGILAAGLLSMPGPSPAADTVSALPTIAAVVWRAEAIFAGTVDRSWVYLDRRVHVLVERAVLKDVVVVKGPSARALRISFWTGEPGEKSPLGRKPAWLRRGGRYIVLTSEPLNADRSGYTSITSADAGLYSVRYDARRRRSLLHDSAGRPVARMDRNRVVVIEPMPESATGSPGEPPANRDLSRVPWIEVLPAGEDPGTRVGEKDFLLVVREILATKPSPDGTEKSGDVLRP